MCTYVCTHKGMLRMYSHNQISFGGIPNSSSLLPCLTTWAHSCSAMDVITKRGSKTITYSSCSCQGCKATNHTGTLLNLPKHWNSGTLRNLPDSGTCLRNLHQHTPELSGTFWNLPPEPAPATRTGTHRSLSGLKTPLAYAVGEKCKGKAYLEANTQFLCHFDVGTKVDTCTTACFLEHTLKSKAEGVGRS